MIAISTRIHNKMADSKPGAEGDASAKRVEGKGDRREGSAWFRGRKLFQLDVNYRWSNIVRDDRFDSEEEAAKQPDAYGVEGAEARAGDRAPDAPELLVVSKAASHSETDVEKTTRFFELFTPVAHTVLVFSPQKSKETTHAILEAARKYPQALVRVVLVLDSNGPQTGDKLAEVDFVVKDTKDHAHKAYGLTVESLHVVVVRPDGIIGAFTDSAAGMERYFAHVLKID